MPTTGFVWLAAHDVPSLEIGVQLLPRRVRSAPLPSQLLIRERILHVST
jgi:hypothetical protein